MPTPTLDALDYGDERLEYIQARLIEDHPTAGLLVTRLLDLTGPGDDDGGGPGDGGLPDQIEDVMDLVYAETSEMRRSHLAVLIALVTDGCTLLRHLLAGVDEARLPDPEILDSVLESLEQISEPLTEVALTLSQPRERNH
ncbi:hypothetical protein [Actinomadura atramentaria]|uniref:hypothetical protein n=1 Tax=Actinomadura atramentaria TaxID=1990 RepID=UPI00036AF970|nr:hypothetical protein [Actinomadura atramentaria]